MLRSAVERKLEIIGKAVSQLSKIAPALAANIPEVPQVVGLRNILIHGYATTDNEIVWRTVQVDIPALRRRVDAMLQQLGKVQ